MEASSPSPWVTVTGPAVIVVVMILVVTLGPKMMDGVDELENEGKPWLGPLENPELGALDVMGELMLPWEVEGADGGEDGAVPEEGVRDGIE